MRGKALSLALAVCLLGLMLLAPAWAAEPAGGYLSGYSEVDPRPSASSWWATLAYLLSLFAVFAFVVLLAYLASRFLSGRFAATGSGQNGQILSHLPLGPNRSVCVVEGALFSSQLGSFEELARRIPSLFRNGPGRR